jgi:hypothetical protein
MATAASSARTIERTWASQAVQPHARSYPSLPQEYTYIFMYILYSIYTYIYTYAYARIYIYIYVYIIFNIYIYIRMHTYIHTSTPSLVRAAIPTHGNTRACARPHVCAHTRARIGGAAAHNGPRRTDVPAERVPPAVARRPGRKGGAYLIQEGDRGGVPRADVRVERRRRVERLQAEPPAVHADGRRSHVTARMRARPIAHAHTRAHGHSTCARMYGGPASAIRSSVYPDTHGYRCMHALGIHTLCMCALHRWMALRRERVALAHMPRISASSAPARDRTRMQEHTRVRSYIPGLCIDIRIYMYIFMYLVHDVCVGCIPADVPTRMRT